MKYYDLMECQYLFSTYGEFKKKKRIIMEAYARWNKQQIVIYRMYVFSRPILKDKQKEWIWEELNRYSYIFNNRSEFDESSS